METFGTPCIAMIMARKRQLTKEDRQTIITVKSVGLSLREIGKSQGVSEYSFQQNVGNVDQRCKKQNGKNGVDDDMMDECIASQTIACSQIMRKR